MPSLAVLAAEEAPERAPAGEPLHVHAVGDEAAGGLELGVVILGELREAELLRDVDLLATRELELGADQGLGGNRQLLLLGADGDEHLTNRHTGRRAVGLAEGTAHARGQTIGASAGERLVDTQHVEGVRANADVVEVPSSVGDHVLVRGDTGRLKGLARDLLHLIAHHVRNRRELLARDLLLARVEDPDLRVRHAAHEARLRPRLAVAVAVATSRTPPHG
mmetsp:Transcript_30029/g.89206  ORF Transcript_30029/g.89206 Transcript_30029/m.89206 type:complete len:221 (-) Transcript_30029:82-744(-)